MAKTKVEEGEKYKLGLIELREVFELTGLAMLIQRLRSEAAQCNGEISAQKYLRARNLERELKKRYKKLSKQAKAALQGLCELEKLELVNFADA